MSQSPERQFIHDLLNPLAVAVGMLDRALIDIETLPDSPERTKIIERLQKTQKAVNRTVDLIRTRREILIQADAAAATDPSKKQAA